MIQVESSVLIRRPLETVFAFVSDIRNSRKWQVGLARISIETATLIQTGTRMQRAYRVVGLPMEDLAEVSCHEENRRFGIKSSSGLFESDAIYHFEPMGEGTQIAWTCRVQAKSPYRFAEALIGQVMAMEAETSFAILKNLLEAEPAKAYTQSSVSSNESG